MGKTKVYVFGRRHQRKNQGAENQKHSLGQTFSIIQNLPSKMSFYSKYSFEFFGIFVPAFESLGENAHYILYNLGGYVPQNFSNCSFHAQKRGESIARILQQIFVNVVKDLSFSSIILTPRFYRTLH